jgi:hypothetical protein
MPRFRITVAFGIVLASVLSVVMAWQASRAGELSGNTDEDTRQNTVVAETLRLNDTSTLVDDLRTFGRYEDALLSARVQELAADRIAGDDPEAAERLRERAAADRDEAEAVRASFLVAIPAPDPQTGDPSIDPTATRAILDRFTEPRIRELRPDALRAEARAAGLRSERLTGLAALAIGATFLLTLAEVVRGSPARLLAGAGATVCGIVVVLYALV